mmetsp:Transcript_33944/g.100829  ORF Transcript_33944/g.100829 Transcript_33944/m.100829 type:complete len:232 (-) Transcript_33944:196-891(-)
MDSSLDSALCMSASGTPNSSPEPMDLSLTSFMIVSTFSLMSSRWLANPGMICATLLSMESRPGAAATALWMAKGTSAGPRWRAPFQGIHGSCRSRAMGSRPTRNSAIEVATVCVLARYAGETAALAASAFSMARSRCPDTGFTLASRASTEAWKVSCASVGVSPLWRMASSICASKVFTSAFACFVTFCRSKRPLSRASTAVNLFTSLEAPREKALVIVAMPPALAATRSS